VHHWWPWRRERQPSTGAAARYFGRASLPPALRDGGVCGELPDLLRLRPEEGKAAAGPTGSAGSTQCRGRLPGQGSKTGSS
jgi:hypothetical protein